MRPVVPAASLFALLLVSTSSKAQSSTSDACALLNQTEAGAAIGAASQPGHPLVPNTKGTCIWSDDPAASASYRRVTVTMMIGPVFEHMKSNPAIKTERETAVPDEAYYVLDKSADPILIARRNGTYFMIKILNGFKVKPPLSATEVKKRLLLLGQYASGRV